jgi:hypothetical protein
VKQKLLKQMEAAQNDPQQAQAKQVALAGESAKVDETQSKTIKNIAQAKKLGFDAAIDAASLGLDAMSVANQAAGAPASPQGAPAAPQPLPSAGAPGAFGPVPGAVSPSQDLPSNAQPPLPFPGMIPPGALSR